MKISYPDSSVTQKRLWKNKIAIRILRKLGFTVIPVRIGGESEFGGESVYFTASSLPIDWESEIDRKL